MLKTKSLNHLSGAIFIELVFTIPIILLLIGSIIFMSELINAAGQLRLAANEGPRFATTRGNKFFFLDGVTETTVHSGLDNYINGTGSLPSLLYSGFSTNDAEAAYGSTDACWKKLKEGESCSPISEAHPIDLYALAYTYSILRIGIPSSKFPCNTSVENSSSDEGCIKCVIAAPLPRTSDPCPIDDSGNKHLSCPFDRALPDVGVICSYNPKGTSARMLDRLIRFFTRGNGGLPEMLLTASTYPPGIQDGTGNVGL